MPKSIEEVPVLLPPVLALTYNYARIIRKIMAYIDDTSASMTFGSSSEPVFYPPCFVPSASINKKKEVIKYLISSFFSTLSSNSVRHFFFLLKNPFGDIVLNEILIYIFSRQINLNSTLRNTTKKLIFLNFTPLRIRCKVAEFRFL